MPFGLRSGCRCRLWCNLVHEKTAGNPFFCRFSFSDSLAEEGLLLALITRRRRVGPGISDRDLAKRATRIMSWTSLDLAAHSFARRNRKQALHGKLACLGNVAAIATLSNVLETPERTGARGAVFAGDAAMN